MNDYFVPGGIDWTAGIWAALNSDPFLVHFTHRWWAWVVVGFLLILARRIRGRSRAASIAIHSAFGTQILLGIATVMTGMNIMLAVSHQAVGALLVASTAWGVHVLGRK
jgi:cytochrome c oxidase assembly protein subunit 15